MAEGWSNDEVDHLRTASLHWLRHTSATFDAPHQLGIDRANLLCSCIDGDKTLRPFPIPVEPKSIAALPMFIAQPPD